MQIKYVHPVLQDCKDVIHRVNRIDGSFMCVTYKFKYDIPLLSDKPVVKYNNLTYSNENTVYDYSALNKAESVQDAYKILENIDLFKTYSISSIKVEQYNEIMKNNATAAHRLKELKQQDDMLAALEGL